MAAIGRLCCKSLFALLIANFLSCRRGFRVSMWGTSSPGDQLTGDSVTRLTPHLSAIVACFDFWREICHPAFSDFCNTICTLLPRANAAACPQLAEPDVRPPRRESGFDRGRVKTRLHDCVGSDTRAGGRTCT